MRSIVSGCLLVPMFLLVFAPVNAQFLQEFDHMELSLFSTASAEQNQSFWLTRNRWGMFEESSANGLMRFSANTGLDRSGRFDWGAGISVIGRASSHSSIYFQEAWIEANILGGIHLQAGRFRKTDGHLNTSLSSGSMGFSPNATPMPRILAEAPEFIEVPMTRGWLEFKGHYGHGWLNDTRSVQGAMLHDKSFYLQTGGNTGVKLFAGLVHYVKWGGVSEFEGRVPQSFRDYLKVVVGHEGGELAPEGERMNALGDHLGFWDWGITFSTAGREFYLYYQHFFETNSGLVYRNLRDGLYGFEVENVSRSGRVGNFVYEFIYTKHQTGPGLTDPNPGDSPPFCEEINCGYRFNGRDDYYNNYLYRTGWTYHMNVIGNPLFLTERQLNFLDPEIETYNNRRLIVSNRFLAHHIGLDGYLGGRVSWRTLLTYIRHYGTYKGLNFGESWGSKNPENNPEDYFFNPPQHQWYGMVELEYRPSFRENLSFQIALAFDRGDLFRNAGIMTGVSWIW